MTRSKTYRQALGAEGEARARGFLESKGYRFVEANWHCEIGELDLVMLDAEELVFVEVKTRRGDSSGRAEESVGRAKSRSLLAAADWYVSEHSAVQDRIWRIDLLALTYRSDGTLQRATHIMNAIVAE